MSEHQIGTVNESPLHAGLKEWYAQPGDRFEVDIEGYIVDIVRGTELIEIQTGNFSSIKSKVRTLAREHPLRLVYPIPYEKWLLKLPKQEGGKVKRRKSPKRGRVEDVFAELVRIPRLLVEESFSLEVVLTREDEVRRYDGERAWRRNGWVIVERRLLEVVEHHVFETPLDLCALLPPDMEEPFTTATMAEALDAPRWLAQKMAYCLRKMGAVTPIGKEGNAILYVR